MPSPRIRRLMLDYELLRRVLNNHPLIQITGTAGLPPEIYRFTYTLEGLWASPSGDIVERGTHILEVNLSLDYPRRAPQCRMLTPIFHPNFDDSSVCIGDFWAASEGLDDLVFRIGRMIAYQEYNTKSPLNGLAAKWAAEHAHLLPVDGRNIAPANAATEPASQAQFSESQMSSVASPRASMQSASETSRQEPVPNSPAGQGDPWATKIVIRNT
jgi:ubiquitin-protein ligase